MVAAILALVAVRAAVRARALPPGRRGRPAAALPRGASALVVAGLSVLFPPLALVVVGGLVFLLAGGQRREGEKYAGLRILR